MNCKTSSSDGFEWHVSEEVYGRGVRLLVLTQEKEPAGINLASRWALNFIVASRRFAMIKKVKAGYKVVSSKGRNLGGPYKTLEEAKKRLRQVEFFKHRKT